MRDLRHYLKAFSSTDTVGRSLLGRALYVAEHGPEEIDPPTADDLGDIIRGLPEQLSADDAVRIVAAVGLLRASKAEQPEAGKLIRAAREGLEWSQAEMGERLGLPIQREYECRTLQNWERGEKSPGWKNRQAIAELAGNLGN